MAASNRSLAFEPHYIQDTSSGRMCICEFRYIWNPNGICGSWRSAKFTNSRLFAWVLCGSAGLHAGYGIWLIQASSREQVLLSRRTVLRMFNSLGIVVNWEQSQLFCRIRRRSTSESYWTLSVSGLVQPRNDSKSFSHLALCFYHEWMNLRILARVDGDAVLSDSAYSGGTAADTVVPVCPSSGLGPFRSRRFCAVVFGDPPGSFLVV